MCGIRWKGESGMPCQHLLVSYVLLHHLVFTSNLWASWLMCSWTNSSSQCHTGTVLQDNLWGISKCVQLKDQSLLHLFPCTKLAVMETASEVSLCWNINFSNHYYYNCTLLTHSFRVLSKFAVTRCSLVNNWSYFLHNITDGSPRHTSGIFTTKNCKKICLTASPCPPPLSVHIQQLKNCWLDFHEILNKGVLLVKWLFTVKCFIKPDHTAIAIWYSQMF
jgi:hypothetical protein